MGNKYTDVYAEMQSEICGLKDEIEALKTFKAKAIELYPSLAHDWRRIERSTMEHARAHGDSEEDGA